MSDIATVAYELRWVIAAALVMFGAATFALGLGRAAGRPMPQPIDADWEQHVADAVALSETPIFAATAAHIAKHAAENIATEWAELNGEPS